LMGHSLHQEVGLLPINLKNKITHNALNLAYESFKLQHL
jgi:hypothetical protein